LNQSAGKRRDKPGAADGTTLEGLVAGFDNFTVI